MSKNVRLMGWSIHEYRTSGNGTEGKLPRTKSIVAASSCRSSRHPFTLQMTSFPIPQMAPPLSHSWIQSIAESPSLKVVRIDSSLGRR
jgi:hypothetical protein